MVDLQSIYRPLAAAPVRGLRSYREYPPCKALRPYIRCFWRIDSDCGAPGEGWLVNPDTCMDIIFSLGNGREVSWFCGINDRPFVSGAGNHRWYAIRFYGWAVSLLSQEPLTEVGNVNCDPQRYFGAVARRLSPTVMGAADFDQWKSRAEQIIAQALASREWEPRVMNTVYQMLAGKGRHTVAELAAYSCVSPRHLERLFREHIGVSPKKLGDLVRYQFLWRELVSSPRLDLVDAAYRFGYTDQSHLMRDFRKYHGVSVSQARKQIVGFLQDSTRSSPYNE